METITSMLELSLGMTIIFEAIKLFFLYLFLITAIKHGVKNGILEAENEKNKKYKSPKKEFEEEMRGWD